MSERRGSFRGSGGLTLRTRVWDPATDPVGRVVVVHGFSEHCGRYRELATRLAERGFGVFAYDQRGHGMSGGRRGRLDDFDDLVRDLERAMDRAQDVLPGRGTPFLFGHSLGGLVALRFLQTGDRGVPAAVLSAPWLGTVAEVPLVKRLLEPVLRAVAPGFTVRNEMRPELLTADPARQKARVDDPLVHQRISAGLLAEVERAQKSALHDDLDPALPVLVLAPTADRLTDQALVEEHFGSPSGSIELRRLEGIRHEPLNDIGRASVIDQIVRFFERALDPAEPEGEGRVRS